MSELPGASPPGPPRALPWTRWGAYSARQTPSCVQQWPTVIASCACGATPDPVSGNNWVITKYASQFFKAGYGPVQSFLPPCECLVCSDVSDLCHEIAITWLLGTVAFDDMVIRCHYRMICINLRQYSSLRDLFHQNLSLCWPTGRKPGIWNPVWTKLYSITILRSALYGEIIWRVCKVYYTTVYDVVEIDLQTTCINRKDIPHPWVILSLPMRHIIYWWGI